MDKEIKKLLRKHKWRIRRLEVKYHIRLLRNKRVNWKIRLSYFFMQVLFRRCEGKKHRCAGGGAYFAGINTAYHEELNNYMFGCKDCHDETNRYYDDLWAEYWSGRF